MQKSATLDGMHTMHEPGLAGFVFQHHMMKLLLDYPPLRIFLNIQALMWSP